MWSGVFSQKNDPFTVVLTSLPQFDMAPPLFPARLLRNQQSLPIVLLPLFLWIPPPTLLAEFPAKTQLVKDGLLPTVDIAPPSGAELSMNVQLSSVGLLA